MRQQRTDGDRLAGRRLLVVSASSGIGLAVGLEANRQGAAVTFTASPTRTDVRLTARS